MVTCTYCDSVLAEKATEAASSILNGEVLPIGNVGAGAVVVILVVDFYIHVKEQR